MAELDAFDRQLLGLLQENARLTGRELSERVGLSAAACLRRVQRLRETGAIAREVAVLAPGALGPSVTLVVMLETARDRPDRIDRVKRRLLALPAVERVFHITGNADLMLILTVPSMEDYTALTEAEFYSDGINGFETRVIMREYRRGE